MEEKRLVLKTRAFLGNKIAEEECLPEKPEVGKSYKFSVVGVVNKSENVSLYEETLTGNLEGPIAIVDVVETVHTRRYGRKWTLGNYVVKKVLKGIAKG